MPASNTLTPRSAPVIFQTDAFTAPGQPLKRFSVGHSDQARQTSGFPSDVYNVPQQPVKRVSVTNQTPNPDQVIESASVQAENERLSAELEATYAKAAATERDLTELRARVGWGRVRQ